MGWRTRRIYLKIPRINLLLSWGNNLYYESTEMFFNTVQVSLNQSEIFLLVLGILKKTSYRTDMNTLLEKIVIRNRFQKVNKYTFITLGWLKYNTCILILFSFSFIFVFISSNTRQWIASSHICWKKKQAKRKGGLYHKTQVNDL